MALCYLPPNMPKCPSLRTSVGSTSSILLLEACFGQRLSYLYEVYIQAKNPIRLLSHISCCISCSWMPRLRSTLRLILLDSLVQAGDLVETPGAWAAGTGHFSGFQDFGVLLIKLQEAEVRLKTGPCFAALTAGLWKLTQMTKQVVVCTRYLGSRLWSSPYGLLVPWLGCCHFMGPS